MSQAKQDKRTPAQKAAETRAFNKLQEEQKEKRLQDEVEATGGRTSKRAAKENAAWRQGLRRGPKLDTTDSRKRGNSDALPPKAKRIKNSNEEVDVNTQTYPAEINSESLGNMEVDKAQSVSEGEDGGTIGTVGTKTVDKRVPVKPARYLPPEDIPLPAAQKAGSTSYTESNLERKSKAHTTTVTGWDSEDDMDVEEVAGDERQREEESGEEEDIEEVHQWESDMDNMRPKWGDESDDISRAPKVPNHHPKSTFNSTETESPSSYTPALTTPEKTDWCSRANWDFHQTQLESGTDTFPPQTQGSVIGSPVSIHSDSDGEIPDTSPFIQLRKEGPQGSNHQGGRKAPAVLRDLRIPHSGSETLNPSFSARPRTKHSAVPPQIKPNPPRITYPTIEEQNDEPPPSRQPKAKYAAPPPQLKGKYNAAHAPHMADSEDDLSPPPSTQPRTKHIPPSHPKHKNKAVTGPSGSAPNINHPTFKGNTKAPAPSQPQKKKQTTTIKPLGKRQLAKIKEVPQWTAADIKRENDELDDENLLTLANPIGPREERRWPLVTRLVYHPNPNASLRILEQSIAIQTVIRNGIKKIIDYGLLENSFPDPSELEKVSFRCLRRAADIARQPDIRHRLVEDEAYREELGVLLHGRLGLIRSNSHSTALLSVNSHYDFMQSSDRAQAIKDLLRANSFRCGLNANGKPDGARPFQHPAIIAMMQYIHKTHYKNVTSHYTSSVPEDPVRSREREAPIPMVALATTMIQAVLLRWQTGKFIPAKFDADEHASNYQHHADALETMKLTPHTKLKFHKMMSNIYIGMMCDTEGNSMEVDDLLDIDGMEE